jgi:protein gp37
MADKTGIAWTDATWNPVTGCTKVSPGCAHCYAEALSKRFGRSFEVTLHPERLDEPLHWRKPRRVFVCSMADLFHEQVRETRSVTPRRLFASSARSRSSVRCRRSGLHLRGLRGDRPRAAAHLPTSHEAPGAHGEGCSAHLLGWR